MKILIVDDEQDIRENLAHLVELEHMTPLIAQNGLSAIRILQDEVVAAVVTDFRMPGVDGLGLLKWIQEEGPTVPVIMMSGHGDITDAVEAMKLGAQDYIIKPFDSQELFIRLKRLITNQHLQDQIVLGQRNRTGGYSWMGESPPMLEIKKLLEKVAPTPSTVLITGESGTGKEVIARTIHMHSPRAENPFVAINVAGIPENLLENELFGHEKGAFTGASSRKIGMFELASSGTLFLDEIGDMPLHLQSKLLRVIQERKIQRLGGTQSLPIDVRILTATNKQLEVLIEEGLFREDLYYRLNVIHIKLPALKDRKEDIPLLVGHFIKKFNHVIGKSIQGIASDAIQALQNYKFPGNVRELENIIERAVILAETDTITLQDIGIISTTPHTRLKSGTLDELQRQAILETILRWEGNKTRAAQELGITRQTLLNKLKDYGFEDV